ncbi:MAG: tetratricopeptide repeat protein, partial [Alphaproteobacteria bacterium]|nr:tetratricopeptide repeat protein [Alphaproteobacteria bacterium]
MLLPVSMLMCLAPLAAWGTSPTVDQCYLAATKTPPSYEELKVCVKAGSDGSLSARQRGKAWNDLASGLGMLKKWSEMLAASQQAVRLRPDDYWVHVIHSWALGMHWRWHEALAAAERAIGMDPTRPVAHNNRSWALRGLGRNREAVAAAEQALRLGPDEWVRNLAVQNRDLAQKALQTPSQPAKATVPATSLQLGRYHALVI